MPISHVELLLSWQRLQWCDDDDDDDANGRIMSRWRGVQEEGAR
jgi:hypothetical protein